MNYEGMRLVCFRKSLLYENAPNISHVTKPDGSATLCGLRGWVTNEGEFDPRLGVDCLRCAKALEKMEAKVGKKEPTPKDLAGRCLCRLPNVDYHGVLCLNCGKPFALAENPHRKATQ